MNPDERVALLDLEDQFVKRVENFDKLLYLLVDSNIFSEVHKDYILKAGSEDKVKQEFIHSITKRGPLAYDSFVTSLKETGNQLLAYEIEAGKRKGDGDIVRKSIYKMDYNHEVCYRMRSRPKGLALIINIYNFKGKHEPRYGSERDLEKLQVLWKGLGFEVYSHTDLTASEMRKCVMQFSRNEKLYSVDSCIVTIMSHGESWESKRGVSFVSSDNMLVDSQYLVQCFSTDNCPALAKKPKVFFFIACRGDRKEFGVVLDNKELRKSSLSHLKTNNVADSNYERSKSAPACSSEGKRDDHAADIGDIVNNLTVNSSFANDSEEPQDVSNDHRDVSGEPFMYNGKNNLTAVDSVADPTGNITVNGNNDGENRISSTTELDVNLMDPVPNTTFYVDDVHKTSDSVLGNLRDVIIVHSSFAGFVTVRDQVKGTWFVQKIYEAFTERAYNQDLMELLNEAMRNLQEMYSECYGMQLMTFENLHFDKKLYFNPGVYH